MNIPPTIKSIPTSHAYLEKGGYKTNPVNGMPTSWVITAAGDTLNNFSEHEFLGRYIDPDSVPEPLVVPAPEIRKLHAQPGHTNRFYFHEDKESKVIRTDDLPSTKLPDEKLMDSSRFITNSFGKKVYTGTKLQITGSSQVLKQPVAQTAYPPVYKDDSHENIQCLDVDQGMPSSYVYGIIQDQRGDLWFGTDGGGVSRYDGKYFLHFTSREGLSSNSVFNLLEDRDGNLWFGTYGGGVNVYDGEKLITFNEALGLGSNYIKYISQDSAGNVWLGTFGAGVIKWHYQPRIDTTAYFTHYTTNEGLGSDYVLSIAATADEIWVGTFGGGVANFDDDSLFLLTTREGLSNDAVYAIAPDHDGKIWLGTYGGGINILDNHVLRKISSENGLPSDYILSIVVDQKGTIWLGTFGSGLIKFNGESFLVYSENQGLNNNTILAQCVDQNGNVWVGTNGGGVAKVGSQNFIHFTQQNGLSNNTVLSVFQDHDSSLWFGTFAGGINIYDGENFIQINAANGLESDIIRTIIQDNDDNYWIGTYGKGLIRYDGKTFTTINELNGLGSNYIRDLLCDKDGNIWIATDGGGVGKFDGNALWMFTENEGLSSNFVWSISEDHAGNIWFGTHGGGAMKFDGKNLKYYTESNGLVSNKILCIFNDSENNIWLGTAGDGVCKLHDQTITCYNEKTGLSNNVVRSVVEDSLGRIWVATERGISLITKQNQVINLGKYDGLKGLDFSNNGVLIDSENRAWWGTGKCLTMLQIDEYQIANEPPEIYIRNIDVNGHFVDFRDLNDSLRRLIKYDHVQPFQNYPIDPEFSYSCNHLTFYFSAISWNESHKIRYSYRMNGFNSNWSVPSDETKADFKNLPYGDYVFEVCAVGQNGIWSTPCAYSFSILAPWYHTWWARTIFSAMALFVVFLVIRWRTAKLRKRQIMLERDIARATQEIRAQKNSVEKQKKQIEDAHKEITDSINYAERIQRSFLASEKLLQSKLSEYFVLFKPKHVVSGDFYWAAELGNDTFALVCADSTGHGVPGAIMSILNISALENAIERVVEPAAILDETRKIIIERLKKDGSPDGGKDGMDAALLIFDQNRKVLKYAASNNPVWVLRNGNLMEFRADKMPVGKHDSDQIPFSQNLISLEKNDVIYVFTDGFPDQFGGDNLKKGGKKYKYSRLKEFLISIADSPMKDQCQKLNTEFLNWKGDLEQVDDVCIIGVKIH